MFDEEVGSILSNLTVDRDFEEIARLVKEKTILGSDYKTTH
jgi:hypothetical protein